MREINLPCVPEMEKQVIGIIIIEPDSIARIENVLRPEHFYDSTNMAIYSRLLDMYDKGEDISLLTAVTACKGLKLDTNNVAGLLAGYTASVSNTTYIDSFARIIVECYIRRTISIGAQQLTNKANDDSTNVANLINDLNKLNDESNSVIVGGGEAKHISELVSQAIVEAENRQKAHIKGQSIGATTGIKALDRMTNGGWKGSQLIVLAARPAMGKTAVMLHFAISTAQQGKAVCIYALEMSGVSLADRLLCSVADIDAERYKSGQLTSEDWGRINVAQTTIDALPIYIDDNPMASMRHIRTRSKMLQKRGKCDLIFADYLQLVDTSTSKNRNREQEIANASRNAKMIAKELNVPFVLLSQLSRKVEERADKTPQLSDLRESGAIEQDADIVVFIHRPAYYGEETMTAGAMGEISTNGMGILTIAKQRDGKTGNVLFSHNESMTRITDYNSKASSTPF